MVWCYIVGPGDKAPVHMEGDMGMGDVDFSEGLTAVEDMTVEQKRLKQQREKDIHTVVKPGVLNRAYQLAFSFYKAEKLPPESNSFVAVRCCGVVLKTPVIEASENPTYQTTILFPVFTPFLNDNVSVKLWHYNFGRANQFIGQVGEEYGLASEFNLTTLMKVGQVIGTRWFNIYGVREDHIEIYGARTKEGKEFLGRVLMRVSLLSTDNPQLGVVRCNIGREPLSALHLLVVDVYELRNAKDLELKIWVVASVGGKDTDKSACPALSAAERMFKWKMFEQQKIETVEDVFPIQPEQCSDIFLYLWHEEPGFFNNHPKVAGYARIKAKECVSENPLPRWVTFKPLKQNADSPGDLLCNIQFIVKGSNVNRGPVDHEMANYTLLLRVSSAFYVAPYLTDDSTLNTYLEIRAGEYTYQTSRQKGRYPVWYCMV